MLFIPDVPEYERALGVISVVDTANAESLTIPELTSHYDGPIAVNQTDDALEPLSAWYYTSVSVDRGGAAVPRVVVIRRSDIKLRLTTWLLKKLREPGHNKLTGLATHCESVAIN